MSTFDYTRRISTVFWICALITIPFWVVADAAGWDIVFYHNAIASLHAGHDPYADAVAVQDEFHRTLAQHPNAQVPFSYVYSPITLPLLRLIGMFPDTFSLTLYWLILAAAVLGTVWVVTRAAEPDPTTHERTFLRLAVPLLIFCPGLLAHDTLLSGNVAFILYALVFLGAAVGWRRNQWLWCYLAILVASCFKAPLLCLVVIPLFSARRQWLPAATTVAAGIALFAMQPLLWPTLFHNFLRAVELQFSYNRDFGSSPAGVFSAIIVHFGFPYSPASEIFYLIYAIAIFAVLFHLSRLFLSGHFTLQQWIPLLLLGAVLLNPRIMEYDAAPVAIPMALIGWRLFTRILPTKSAAILYFILFLIANCIAQIDSDFWKSTECVLLILSFCFGCWNLFHPAQTLNTRLQATSQPHLTVPV